jgi:two-component system sensor histidine kinase UhpB
MSSGKGANASTRSRIHQPSNKNAMTSGYQPFTGVPAQRPGLLDTAARAVRGLNPFAFVNDSIVQAAREAIVTIDEEQRIVMLNPAAQRMFGLTAADALGKNISQLIPQRFRRAHAAHVRQFDEAGTAERRMGERSNVMGLHADGTEFPIEATISRLDVFDGLGTRRFFTALIRDLSEIHDLRGEIESMNNRLRAIFKVVPVAIWIIDGEQIAFANRACADLFGFADLHDMVGRSIYSLLSAQSQDSVRAAIAQTLGGNVPTTVTDEWVTALDGTQREVEITIAALPDHGASTMQMVITDFTRRNLESPELERSRQQLRQLSASLVDAREGERRRIARELHDELGQRLTALHMELSSLSVATPSAPNHDRITTMLGMVNETVASVRRIATELRPLMLDDLGLTSAIEWLAHDWARRMGIAVKLELHEEGPELSDTMAIALYRMVQEALTNIARHAQAGKVKIRMQQDGDMLVLMVQDDGIGFTDKALAREGSHGLAGMRERAYMLGGKLAVGNSRAGGGSIVVRIPIIPSPSGLNTNTSGEAERRRARRPRRPRIMNHD